MRIATANYDRNGVLVRPYAEFAGNHPTRQKLTMNAGYWHFAELVYLDQTSRDAAYKTALELILANNGTVFKNVRYTDPDTGHHAFRIKYIIEEADHEPCSKYAARSILTGTDPGYRYFFDGIGEHGPDYRCPGPTVAAENYAIGNDNIAPIPAAREHPDYRFDLTSRVKPPAQAKAQAAREKLAAQPQIG